MTSRTVIHELILFFSGTFLLTWIIVGVYAVVPDWATAHLGPMRLGSPVFYVGVGAPSLVALFLTLQRDGLAAAGVLLSKLIQLRVDPLSAALSLLGYPALWLIVAAFVSVSRFGDPRLDLTAWLVTLPGLLLAGHLFRDAGALGEELGWRGYALPRLLTFLSPRTAALVLGCIWGLWHLPAFFVGSLSQSAVGFGPYLLNVIAFSVLMTALYVRTGGNVFWSGVIPHMMFNAVPRSGIPTHAWVTIAIAAILLLALGPSLGAHVQPASGKDFR